MNEPIWLELKAVLVAHDLQLAQHGGLEGVRDFGLLESALARPRMAFCYEQSDLDLQGLAALYMVGIARNHPFFDANKRTALLAGYAFLRLNGVRIVADRVAEVMMMLAVAQGEMDENTLAAWLRARVE